MVSQFRHVFSKLKRIWGICKTRKFVYWMPKMLTIKQQQQQQQLQQQQKDQ